MFNQKPPARLAIVIQAGLSHTYFSQLNLSGSSPRWIAVMRLYRLIMTGNDFPSPMGITLTFLGSRSSVKLSMGTMTTAARRRRC